MWRKRGGAVCVCLICWRPKVCVWSCISPGQVVADGRYLHLLSAMQTNCSHCLGKADPLPLSTAAAWKSHAQLWRDAASYQGGLPGFCTTRYVRLLQASPSLQLPPAGVLTCLPPEGVTASLCFSQMFVSEWFKLGWDWRSVANLSGSSCSE